MSWRWNKKSSRIAFYDAEHGERVTIASFDDFIAQPALCVEKHFNGDYA